MAIFPSVFLLYSDSKKIFLQLSTWAPDTTMQFLRIKKPNPLMKGLGWLKQKHNSLLAYLIDFQLVCKLCSTSK